MHKNKIEKGTWIALCDGARSLILNNVGDERFFHFRLVDTVESFRQKNSEMGRDRPARVHESIGAGRSAIETIDKHEQHEQEFIRSFAQKLSAAVDGKLTTKIVLIAPPKTLGYLRNILPANLTRAISLELEKDLLKMPIPDLEIALKAAVGIR